jgi:hypothetical protein
VLSGVEDAMAGGVAQVTVGVTWFTVSDTVAVETA